MTERRPPNFLFPSLPPSSRFHNFLHTDDHQHQAIDGKFWILAIICFFCANYSTHVLSDEALLNVFKLALSELYAVYCELYVVCYVWTFRFCGLPVPAQQQKSQHNMLLLSLLRRSKADFRSPEAKWRQFFKTAAKKATLRLSQMMSLVLDFFFRTRQEGKKSMLARKKVRVGTRYNTLCWSLSSLLNFLFLSVCAHTGFPNRWSCVNRRKRGRGKTQTAISDTYRELRWWKHSFSQCAGR